MILGRSMTRANNSKQGDHIEMIGQFASGRMHHR